MNNTPEIEILLATYNGERFLREQIDSILAQDYGNWRVLARDDGSTDGTVSILKEYAGRLPSHFRVLPASAGTGHPKWNFLRLMEASTSEYICFADQDDVWLPQKLTLTMQAMGRLEARHGTTVPLLAFTDLRVVDENLATIAESLWKLHCLNPRQVNHFARLIGQNVVTGSTAMANRSLVELALRMPEAADMHDSWVALVASAFGAGEAVPVQTVLYRQHGGNILGAIEMQDRSAAAQPHDNKEEQRRLDLMERQAKAMLRAYGSELPPNKLHLLQNLLRCPQSNQRFVRVWIALRYGLYVPWAPNNLSMLRYLWDMNATSNQTR
ncbi:MULTISPECIES: glycosyltransferase family 2 protein [Acidobacteriaceae]|uniref:glycosyltransferase family 2 protein n=1 Tax=Acidobacteriaceae TaxID=204434 RepID=UPI00131D2F23|nr:MULTISPECIES: glycosyltransferase family 2 protein [Acidobacteriaceae]MDW5267882.1 glycosyltransferase family 2 protein [Edaphobacter sp.]